MGKALPTISVPLDCGHNVEMEEWDKGDRKIDCGTCGRIWILTASKAYVPIYQTKTEIKPFDYNPNKE